MGTGGILKSKPLGLPHKVRYLLSVVSKETEIRNPRKLFLHDMCYVTSAFSSYVVMVDMEAWVFVYVVCGGEVAGLCLALQLVMAVMSREELPRVPCGFSQQHLRTPTGCVARSMECRPSTKLRI